MTNLDHDNAAQQQQQSQNLTDDTTPYNPLMDEPPEGFSSTLEGNSLVIERRWLPSHAPWFLVTIFVVSWALWTHFQILPARDRNELLFYLLFFPLTFYLFLAVFFNVTTLRATPEYEITVQTKPFPLTCARKLEFKTIQRVYYENDMDLDQDSNRTFFKVLGVDGTGNVHVIEQRLAHPCHAQYIAQKLDEYFQGLRRQAERVYEMA